eukprot:NODE_2639_length_1152_cov_24.221215_g2417_i0.p1 GENE.NODE_2639_length_1152_cov_24.221215_g2417_i0~~NODE_2639_length_1152_cov_24.221215_g2417_i0.p1  ORF type:complete len:265 (-),score=33.31 NODE_2639_length_1152_cov_24.221215_g2417_i0:195-989(-)
MGGALSCSRRAQQPRHRCPRRCCVARLAICEEFDVWLRRNRPRRETCKDFPRVHALQQAESVLEAYFTKKTDGCEAKEDSAMSLECVQLANVLHMLFEQDDQRSEFRELCECLDSILQAPHSFPSFLKPWEMLRHAHGPAGTIVVFELPVDVPHLVIVHFYGSPAVLVQLKFLQAGAVAGVGVGTDVLGRRRPPPTPPLFPLADLEDFECASTTCASLSEDSLRSYGPSSSVITLPNGSRIDHVEAFKSSRSHTQLVSMESVDA